MVFMRRNPYLLLCVAASSLNACTRTRSDQGTVPIPAAPAVLPAFPEETFDCDGPDMGRRGFVAVRFFDGNQPMEAAPFAKTLPTPVPPIPMPLPYRKVTRSSVPYSFQFGSLAVFGQHLSPTDFSYYAGAPAFAFSYEHRGQTMTLFLKNVLTLHEYHYIDSVSFHPGFYQLTVEPYQGRIALADPGTVRGKDAYERIWQEVTFRGYVHQHAAELAAHNPFAGRQCTTSIYDYRSRGYVLGPADSYIEQHLTHKFRTYRVASLTKL